MTRGRFPGNRAKVLGGDFASSSAGTFGLRDVGAEESRRQAENVPASRRLRPQVFPQMSQRQRKKIRQGVRVVQSTFLRRVCVGSLSAILSCRLLAPPLFPVVFLLNFFLKLSLSQRMHRCH